MKVINKLDPSKENKKLRYDIRIEEKILSELKELSNILNISNSELIRNILKDYMEGKIVYNSYLNTYKSRYIFLPLNLIVKQEAIEQYTELTNDIEFFQTVEIVQQLYKEDVNNINFLYTNQKEAIDKNDFKLLNNYSVPDLDTKEEYKILRIPNNLDTFNYDINSYCFNSEKGKHKGIELYINTDILKFCEETDFLNCLYCLFFEIENNEEPDIRLINNVKCGNLINKSGNNYLINLYEAIYTSLKSAKTIDEVLKIAKKYNTGNIINIKTENEVTVYKLIETENSKVQINYHDKQLLKKVKRLEKDNIKLQKEIDNLKIEKINMNKNLRKEAEKAVNNLLYEYFPEKNKK